MLSATFLTSLAATSFFLVTRSPASMTPSLVLLTLIFATLAGSSLPYNPWYAYLLFFVFLGGLLVILSYVVSLSPPSRAGGGSLMPALLLSVMFLLGGAYNLGVSDYPTMSISPDFNPLLALSSTPLTPLLLALFLYLLLALVMIMFMIKKFAAPLRPLV